VLPVVHLDEQDRGLGGDVVVGRGEGGVVGAEAAGDRVDGLGVGRPLALDLQLILGFSPA